MYNNHFAIHLKLTHRNFTIFTTKKLFLKLQKKELKRIKRKLHFILLFYTQINIHEKKLYHVIKKKKKNKKKKIKC